MAVCIFQNDTKQVQSCADTAALQRRCPLNALNALIRLLAAQAEEWLATKCTGLSSQDEFVLDTAALERQKVPSGAAVAAAWSDDDATPAAKRLRQGHDPHLVPVVGSGSASSLEQ